MTHTRFSLGEADATSASTPTRMHMVSWTSSATAPSPSWAPDVSAGRVLDTGRRIGWWDFAWLKHRSIPRRWMGKAVSEQSQTPCDG
jgi:hypothetical protein